MHNNNIVNITGFKIYDQSAILFTDLGISMRHLLYYHTYVEVDHCEDSPGVSALFQCNLSQ